MVKLLCARLRVKCMAGDVRPDALHSMSTPRVNASTWGMKQGGTGTVSGFVGLGLEGVSGMGARHVVSLKVEPPGRFIRSQGSISASSSSSSPLGDEGRLVWMAFQ